MSGLVGNVDSLKRFSQRLRELPRVVAQKVAAASAPALTAAARSTFDAGEDAFGVSWVPNADGKRATLTRTGALGGKIAYVAIGTIVRAVLGVSYARYQIGRRPVFPKQGEPLPASYTAALREATARVIAAELAET